MADYIDSSAKKNTINRWDDNESDIKRYKTRLNFWWKLLVEVNKKTKLFANVNPRKDHWLFTGAWVAGISYTFIITKKYVSVELWINRGDIIKNKQAFDLLSKFRNEIDEQFWVTPSLEWSRMDDKVMSRIEAILPWVSYFEEQDQSRIIEFLVENIIKLEKAFSPYIQKIKNLQ
jgi:hypothetical protein